MPESHIKTVELAIQDALRESRTGTLGASGEFRVKLLTQLAMDIWRHERRPTANDRERSDHLRARMDEVMAQLRSSEGESRA
jgi:hypothetical protein